jgi:opacity protein-like surface antigen
MRLRFSFVILCTAALAAAAAPAHGQTSGQAGRSDEVNWKLGPRFTADAGDIDDVALGGALRVGSPSFPVQGSGAFDLYLSDGGATVFTVDLNGQIPIEVEPWFLPYVGAGLGITRASGSAGGESTTDLGFNLMGGAEVDLRVVNPFVQAQVTLGDQIDRLGITGGVLIDI